MPCKQCQTSCRDMGNLDCLTALLATAPFCTLQLYTIGGRQESSPLAVAGAKAGLVDGPPARAAVLLPPFHSHTFAPIVSALHRQ